MKSNKKADFIASYSRKDLILYALAIGCGSSSEDKSDQRYVYEKDRDFAVFPTFPVVLLFHARTKDTLTNDIPEFPPPMLAAQGVLPRKYLKDAASIQDSPILHTWQSMEIVKELPVPRNPVSPIECNLETNIMEVKPRSIGTFVTSETIIRIHEASYCKLRQTYLVMGVNDTVVPYQSRSNEMKREPVRIPDRPPDQINKYRIFANQALLYRMASGDTNKIHVDPESVPFLPTESDDKKPILHGLCTFGIIARYLKLPSIDYMEARFSKPVFVGDEITIRVWHDKSRVYFEAQDSSGDLIVSHGLAKSTRIQSRL